MHDALALAFLAIAVGALLALVVALRGSYLRGLALDRLVAGEVAEEKRDSDAPSRAAAIAKDALPEQKQRPFVVPHPWIPWSVATAVAILLRLLGLKLPFAIPMGVIVGVVGTLIDKVRVEGQKIKIETQLVDAIDLMVGALRAGSGLLDSLESALTETEEPLSSQLVELTTKIRLGEDPLRALRELGERVPLEAFLLFVLTLSINWEVGGSLAPGLSTSGRTIRDRLELQRRIRSRTTQARVSVIAVLGVSYFIFLLMWRSDPDRMEEFLATEIGGLIVGVALTLQAVGLLWMSWLTEIDH